MTIADSIIEYSHAIADAYPYPPVAESIVLYISTIREFCSLFDINITVYTTLSRIIGFTVGSVIFQKHSHLEPPSIFAASYSEVSIFCSAARNISICTPEYHKSVIILLNTLVMLAASTLGRYSSKSCSIIVTFIIGMLAAS